MFRIVVESDGIVRIVGGVVGIGEEGPQQSDRKQASLKRIDLEVRERHVSVEYFDSAGSDACRLVFGEAYFAWIVGGVRPQFEADEPGVFWIEEEPDFEAPSYCDDDVDQILAAGKGHRALVDDFAELVRSMGSQVAPEVQGGKHPAATLGYEVLR